MAEAAKEAAADLEPAAAAAAAAATEAASFGPAAVGAARAAARTFSAQRICVSCHSSHIHSIQCLMLTPLNDYL